MPLMKLGVGLSSREKVWRSNNDILMFVSATASNLQSGKISLINLEMPLSQAHTNNVFSTSCIYNAYLDMGLCTQSVRKGWG